VSRVHGPRSVLDPGAIKQLDGTNLPRNGPMTLAEHDKYATELLLHLPSGHAADAGPPFSPNPRQSRNAAKAMTTILCHRLLKNSGQQPMPRKYQDLEWNGGVFNCRNLADRNYMWTNLRPTVADELHLMANSRPVAYLLACCPPEETSFDVWAIPEPVLYESLSGLVFEEGGNKYTVQIWPDEQRIHKSSTSPDLTPYHRRFRLTPQELLVLKEAREVDAVAKKDRSAREDESSDGEDVDGHTAAEVQTRELLTTAARQLTEEGFFDPAGIIDARDRVLSSIVRRRGRPAFRQTLLVAYNGQCAISGCTVEAVLDAAHIVPYMGPATNHPGNGLLLRTDLHTLFDLKLIAVDVENMCLLVSPFLAGTCYDEYRGRLIRIPAEPGDRPSPEALEKHREESGL
jgi:HNH endonuclease